MKYWSSNFFGKIRGLPYRFVRWVAVYKSVYKTKALRQDIWISTFLVFCTLK